MRIVSALLALALLSACGGNDDSTLHMRGFDISPANYQAVIRAEMAANMVGFGVICKQVDGLGDEALVNFFKQLSASSAATPTVPKGGIAKPGQTLKDDDGRRAAKIIQSECNRTF